MVKATKKTVKKINCNQCEMEILISVIGGASCLVAEDSSYLNVDGVKKKERNPLCPYGNLCAVDSTDHIWETVFAGNYTLMI